MTLPLKRLEEEEGTVTSELLLAEARHMGRLGYTHAVKPNNCKTLGCWVEGRNPTYILDDRTCETSEVRYASGVCPLGNRFPFCSLYIALQMIILSIGLFFLY
jgi:hypothetical protein